MLSAQTRGERRVTLTTPVRWAAGDPLERFIFRALMLDAGATTSVDRPVDLTSGFHTDLELSSAPILLLMDIKFFERVGYVF